ncbi:MFS general substrate transporter [Amylocystis lapponica]|nr:MFS general substrate transporter [Amylocystis lapponica]
MNSVPLATLSSQTLVPPPPATSVYLEARVPEPIDTAVVKQDECSPNGPPLPGKVQNERHELNSVTARQEAEATAPQLDQGEDEEPERPPLTSMQIQMVILALSVAAFLGSLDQTIMATAMATIAGDFGKLHEQSWISLSYLLTSTVFQPFFGRATDLYGSRIMLFIAIAVFDIGSLLCAVATNFIWFCCGRAIAGIGAAGLLVIVMVIVSQMVPLRERGKYVGVMYARTAIATVLGPLLGGVFSRFNWRWCFYINLILSVPAVGVLFLHLKKIPNNKKADVSLRDIDFGGILLLTTFVLSLALALSWGGTAYPWNSAVIIALLSAGCAFVPIFVVYEIRIPRFPVVPMQMFKVRNVAASTGCYFFISMSMYGVPTYIPSYYQLVRGDTQLISGLEVLPYVLALIVSTTLVGHLMARSGRTRPWLWLGNAVNVLGNGLLVLLDGARPRAAEYAALAVAGAGTGFIAQTNTVSAQSRVPRRLLASVTTMTQWSKSLGGIVGIAVEGAIVENRFLKALEATPAAAPYVDRLFAGYRLDELPEGVRADASAAYGHGFSTMMIATTCLCAVGMLFSFSAQEADLGREKAQDKETTLVRAVPHAEGGKQGERPPHV